MPGGVGNKFPTPFLVTWRIIFHSYRDLMTKPGSSPSIRLMGALLLFVVCGFVAMLLSATTAKADDVGIFVAPQFEETTPTPAREYVLEIVLDPGRGILVDISVFNQSPHTVSISTSIAPYADAVVAGTVEEWLTVDPTSFLLAGFDDKTITIVVELPEGEVISGGATVILDAISVDPLQDFGATSGQAFVSLLINVERPSSPEAATASPAVPTTSLPTSQPSPTVEAATVSPVAPTTSLPTSQPSPTIAPRKSGGGCSSPGHDVLGLQGGWILFGLTVLGLMLGGRKTKV